jgi:hypothetical protein
VTTYRGDEVPKPDLLDADLKLVGARLGGMENVEEELKLPPSAEPDYLPKPGQKHYMETQPMADWRSRDTKYGVLQIPTDPTRAMKATGWGEQPLPSDPNRINAQEFVRRPGPGDTIHAKDEPDDTDKYKQGGKVEYGSQTQDPMPPDQRKLADRINVNEIMQMQDDRRAGGWGTTRETMPPPPTSEAYSSGGRVKHGSSTVVSCRTKHGGGHG